MKRFSKVLCVVLVLMLAAAALSGCLIKNPFATLKPGQTDKNGNTQKPGSTESGSYISNFYTQYSDARKPMSDKVDAKINGDETPDLDLTMAYLGVAMGEMVWIDVLFFDAIGAWTDGDYTGKLLFTEIDAYKKVHGNTVEFGYDYTVKDGDNSGETGDHNVTKGTFDKAAGKLKYEATTTRGGNVISRRTGEIVRNAADSYSSQVYMWNSDEGPSDVSLVAIWFDADSYQCYMATKAESASNFTVNSIYDKTNQKPDAMTAGYEIQYKINVEGANVTWQKVSAD